jgi:hypothetical protein
VEWSCATRSLAQEWLEKHSGRTNVSYLTEKYEKRKRMQFGQTLLAANMSFVGHKVHLQALNVWIVRATRLGKSYMPFNAARGLASHTPLPHWAAHFYIFFHFFFYFLFLFIFVFRIYL